MSYLVTVNGRNINIKSSEESYVSADDAAAMLRLHSAYMGYMLGHLDEEASNKILDFLKTTFFAIMANGFSSVEFETDKPFSMFFNLEEKYATPSFKDTVPSKLLEGFLEVFIVLSQFLYGDIQYVLFFSEIRNAFDKGKKTAKKERGVD